MSDEELFLSSDSPSGTLRCIIEGDGNAIWMYLQDIEKEAVIGDAPICSIAPLMTQEEFKASYRGKGAPPLVQEFTSERAVIPDIHRKRVSILWDSEERHVTGFIDSAAVSRIEIGKKAGLSIFTLKSGPWGRPWQGEPVAES